MALSLNGQREPGLIAVIANDTARFSVFGVSLSRLLAPPGSMMEWFIGHDIAANHNDAVSAMLSNPSLKWLFIMGDDHAFEGELLLSLLDRQRDIVGPVCLQRMPPYHPTAVGLTPGGVRHYRRLELTELGAGCREVARVGGAGMLVRREVFEQMPEPWFEFGQLDATSLSEDFYFCDKARSQGYTVWLDQDVQIGHCVTGAVWPVPGENGWTYGFAFSGGMSITMPEPYPEEVEV